MARRASLFYGDAQALQESHALRPRQEEMARLLNEHSQSLQRRLDVRLGMERSVPEDSFEKDKDGLRPEPSTMLDRDVKVYVQSVLTRTTQVLRLVSAAEPKITPIIGNQRK